MALPLRLYAPDDSLARLRGDSDPHELFEDYQTPEPTVRVSLRDLLPLVAMAQRMQFIWLKDFLDDEVTITEDLHQVLQSFRGVRPTAG
jgi:hypothetical protein